MSKPGSFVGFQIDAFIFTWKDSTLKDDDL